MVDFLRSMFRQSLIFVLVLLLASCSSGTAGLNTFQSPDGRYAFLYPTGWIRVSVTGGPQVVFHDLINSDETLSLVSSKLEKDVDLESLGSPQAVGERLMGNVNEVDGAVRDVELIKAEAREESQHIFYDLEYLEHLDGVDRHELATVVVDRGYLYTLATGTNEARWQKVKGLFNRVVHSFTFLI